MCSNKLLLTGLAFNSVPPLKYMVQITRVGWGRSRGGGYLDSTVSKYGWVGMCWDNRLIRECLQPVKHLLSLIVNWPRGLPGRGTLCGISLNIAL